MSLVYQYYWLCSRKATAMTNLTTVRINSTSGVPTLVVPLDKYVGPETESRYKAIVDTKSILDFIDKSRTIISRTHTTSSAPAPALAPATIDHLSVTNNLITSLHSPELDPIFFTVSATDQSELAEKANGPAGLYVKQRQEAILRHLASDEANPLSSRYKTLLEKEKEINGALLKVYQSTSGEQDPDTSAFFEKSKKKWQEELKTVLETFEKTIKDNHDSSGESAEAKAAASARGPSAEGEDPPTGTYLLGDQISLVDLHFFVWLARLVYLSGGDLSVAGLSKLEEKINKGGDGWKLGENVRLFWQSILIRDSVKKVYSGGIH
ncbi:hypothetical protein FRC03_000787 [Tulasnella sp. 419]|nr:hypothetical protein FRC03_000787 [Tulasnella sp. 419]